MVTETEFRKAILPFTLHQEGGLSRDRKDPGNWTGGRVGHGAFRGTKYGIAASSHPILDIATLTLEQAGEIYWRDYVRAPGFARLSLPLLMVVFDAGVNCGPARAKAWLRAAEATPGLKPQIAAVSAANLAFHRGLRTWGRYGNVWGARIAACQRQAFLLAATAPVVLTANQPRPAAHIAPVVPKAAEQRPAGTLVLLIRVLIDALFSPARPGANP